MNNRLKITLFMVLAVAGLSVGRAAAQTGTPTPGTTMPSVPQLLDVVDKATTNPTGQGRMNGARRSNWWCCLRCWLCCQASWR
jgi:hypothetical protein